MSILSTLAGFFGIGARPVLTDAEISAFPWHEWGEDKKVAEKTTKRNRRRERHKRRMSGQVDGVYTTPDGYYPAKTMPRGVAVEIITARGYIRLAKRRFKNGRLRPNGTVNCFGQPVAHTLTAIGWRPLPSGQSD